MNTKSKARAPGRRLTSHLGRKDTNEHVSIGASRGVTPTLKEAMEELAIRSATVAAKKSWFHFVGNPDPKESLDAVGWESYWAEVEAEYELGLQPFIEVVHRKHGREHKHRVYNLVRDDGRLVPVSHNYRRNELVSRLCEIANGHSLCPGPHHAWVLGRLAARGVVVPTAAPRRTGPGVGFGQNEHQQAERKLRDGDPRPFRQAVYAIYAAANGDWRAFAFELDRAGITVARGRSALLVIDEASTFHLPLARLLREEAKRVGRPVKITSAELEQVFGRAQTLVDELKTVGERRRDAGRGTRSASWDELNHKDGVIAQKQAEAAKPKTSENAAADAFAQRMTMALHMVLATEQRRRDRLRRNRDRKASRRRPTLDTALASLADAACLKAASHVIWCWRNERVALRTAVLCLGAIAAINGLAPVLLVATAIGFVRRHDIAAERRRFRADVDEVKAARAGFRFADIASDHRPFYAALARALESGGSNPLPVANLEAKQAAAFIAWWVHASDKQRSVIMRWGRATPSRSSSPRRRRPSRSAVER